MLKVNCNFVNNVHLTAVERGKLRFNDHCRKATVEESRIGRIILNRLV